MGIRAAIAVVVLGLSGLVGVAATGGGPDPSVTALGPPAVAVRGPILAVVPMVDFDEQHAIEAERAAFYADVQRQIDEYLAWQHEQDVAAWATAWIAAHPPPAPASRPASTATAGFTNPGPNMGSCSGNVECFLACTIQHESASAGVYNAVSPGGTYRGAYQFDQSTWNGAVARAGYGQYVGTPPNLAPPNVQDAAATQLYGERGNQPWGGRC